MKQLALMLAVVASLCSLAKQADAHGPYGWGPRPAIGFYFNPVVPAPYYYPPPVPRAYGYWAPPPPPVYAPPVYAPPVPSVGLYFGS